MLAVTFIILLVALPLTPSVLPAAYALGCSPNIGEFVSEGPYSSSLQGFVGVGNTVVDNQMYNVLTVEPGSVASFKYAYSNVFQHPWDFTIQPAIKRGTTTPGEGLQWVQSAPSWIEATFDPSAFVIPKGGINVTVTFHISKDAPPGIYELMIAGQAGDSFDLMYCPYAPLTFILKISSERPATVTATQIVSSTVTSTITRTSTEIFTEASTRTSVERITEPNTITWALGATVAAAVLAVVLLLRKT